MRLPRNKRGKMTDEYIEIIYRLWANERASFSGEFYSFEDVSLVVRPVQQPRPEVWVGGSSKASLARAIRVGEGWTPTCFAYPPVQNPVGQDRGRTERRAVVERLHQPPRRAQGVGPTPSGRRPASHRWST